jgi:hypothetical protein
MYYYQKLNSLELRVCENRGKCRGVRKQVLWLPIVVGLHFFYRVSILSLEM